MTLGVRILARLVLSGLLAASAGFVAGAQPAPAASVAKARELAALMKSKKIEVFAMRESVISDRFFAVMLVPDVQMLVVSAAYSRPTDIEYRLYQKDYVTAYQDLSTGALATGRFFVEDVLADGLVATPVKKTPPDSVTVDSARQVFDGAADPKKRNDTRTPRDVYVKAFADADQRYTRLLDGLIEALKKPGILVPAGLLR